MLYWIENITPAVYPIGTPMVLNSEGKCRPFDESKDDVEDIMGCIFAQRDTNNRQSFIQDSVLFLVKDYYVFDLNTLQGSNFYNENWDPSWTPIDNRDVSLIMDSGLCPVSKSLAMKPKRWKLALLNDKPGDFNDVYYVR
jgi:hypothetical protein